MKITLSAKDKGTLFSRRAAEAQRNILPAWFSVLPCALASLREKTALHFLHFSSMRSIP
jgi:hypothetical protein